MPRPHSKNDSISTNCKSIRDDFENISTDLETYLHA